MAEAEAGAFDEDVGTVDVIQTCKARIAALERLVSKQALKLEFLGPLCSLRRFYRTEAP